MESNAQQQVEDKAKSIEALRQQRLAREQAERARTAALLQRAASTGAKVHASLQPPPPSKLSTSSTQPHYWIDKRGSRDEHRAHDERRESSRDRPHTTRPTDDRDRRRHDRYHEHERDRTRERERDRERERIRDGAPAPHVYMERGGSRFRQDW